MNSISVQYIVHGHLRKRVTRQLLSIITQKQYQQICQCKEKRRHKILRKRILIRPMFFDIHCRILTIQISPDTVQHETSQYLYQILIRLYKIYHDRSAESCQYRITQFRYGSAQSGNIARPASFIQSALYA